MFTRSATIAELTYGISAFLNSLNLTVRTSPLFVLQITSVFDLLIITAAIHASESSLMNTCCAASTFVSSISSVVGPILLV